MRSTTESPPHGWIATPPLVVNPVRNWSFNGLCKDVHQLNPSLSEEYVREAVEHQNALRMLNMPDAHRWITVDLSPASIPDLLVQANDSTKLLDQSQDLLLVLPFCAREVSLLLKVLGWMIELGPCGSRDVLLTHDLGISPGEILQIKALIVQFSRNWSELRYPVPPAGYFPPNWAFQCTARFIAGTLRRPWLWFEADMVPLKPNWLQTLQDAYMKGGKPCMGTVVTGMGHVNGTAIYPADYAAWATNAMSSVQTAWDMEQAKDMPGKVHEASYLMQHVWGVIGGRPHASQGPSVSFSGDNEMNWINPGAVTLHRCKDGSLIDRLRERKRCEPKSS